MAQAAARATVRRALSAYRPRNNKLVDAWSFVHLASCAVATVVVGPIVTFLVALAWEPLETQVLSPLLARRGIDFGHESLGNSLSDVAFNGGGVVLGLALAAVTGISPFLA